MLAIVLTFIALAFAAPAAGIVFGVVLAAIRWINREEEYRTPRLLWVLLWSCGLTILTTGLVMLVMIADARLP